MKHFLIALFLSGVASLAQAAEFYVTPSGTGDYGGTNWDNAFNSVQAAATLATNAGDAIYLQSGVYSNASQVVISNAAGLTVYGGRYGGSDLNSNDYSGANSMLTKTGGLMRIVYGCNSTAIIACVTISGGSLAGSINGAGLYLTNCNLTLTNCTVSNNIIGASGSGAAHGAGLCAQGGPLMVVDSFFVANAIPASGSSGSAAWPSGGGAIYYSGSSLTVRNGQFVGNYLSGDWEVYFAGGAIYSMDAEVVITNCVFRGCYRSGGSQRSTVCYGGALSLRGGSATISQCGFSNNYVNSSWHGTVNLEHGGALYATNVNTLTVTDCTFSNNYAYTPSSGDARGSALYCVSSTGEIRNCTLDNAAYYLAASPYAELLRVDGASELVVRNTTIQNTPAQGLYANGGNVTLQHLLVQNCLSQGVCVAGGNVTLSNCLINDSLSDGLLLAGGIAHVVNCTLADNYGWGLNHSGGTGTVFNSIAWGNGTGGFSSNASLAVDYSCAPDLMNGGLGNIQNDPLFASVQGYYYLSANGLKGQPSNSPCIDAGLGSASDCGLDSRTTRTDGTNDSGTVDIGYHYATGVPDSMIVTTVVCYVDAVNGHDATGDGLTWGTAWKSITHALSNVAQHATINIATGVYSSISTEEVFPLTVAKAGLTIQGTNRAATVINANAAGRVLMAMNQGSLRFSGLSIARGSASGMSGAGLYLLGCNAVISNCAVYSNAVSGSGSGGGVYLSGGSLDVADSIFANNTLATGSGAGICSLTGPMTVTNSLFVANSLTNGSGAGIYAAGGALTVADSEFTNNAVTASGSSGSAAWPSGGGAIYYSGSSLTVRHGQFVGNHLSGAWAVYFAGGAIYAVDAAVVITNSDFRSCYISEGNQRTAIGFGGALSLRGGIADIRQCTFSSNYVTYTQSGSANYQYGGALFASNVGALAVANCSFTNNYAWTFASADARGSAICLAGGGLTGTLAQCVIDNSAISIHSPEAIRVDAPGSATITGLDLRKGNREGVCLNGGVSLVVNSLIRNCSNSAVWAASGTGSVVNCTIVSNAGWGVSNDAAALIVKNSIVWDNALGGIWTNAATTISYSDVQDETPLGHGNMSQGPLFVNVASEDYHLMSLAGSWRGGGWTNDAQMSPCIDAGEPASGSAYALEPKPNGGRVNMGAYGNTEQASRSSRGTVIAIW